MNEADNNIIKERRKRIWSKRNLFFLIISIVILYFLISNIDIYKTVETFKNVNLLLLSTTFFLYLASNFFKTLRFKVILNDEKLSIFQLFTIVSYHNFYNQILPARTGELTLIYYLKKIGSIKSSIGLHSLLFVRFFDLLIVAVFFILSILIYYGKNTSIFLTGTAIGVILFSILIMLYLSKILSILFKFLRSIFTFLKLSDKKMISKIDLKLKKLIYEFDSINSKKNIFLLIIISSLIWLSLYTFSYIILKSFHFSISYLQTIIGSTGAILTNVLPINSFGSFGTLEAGWTGGFLLIGLENQKAISSGFGYHFTIFVAGAIIAFCCFIISKIKSFKK